MKLAISLTVSTLVMAQTPATGNKPAFEVAAIHLAKDDGNRDIDVDGGLYRTHNTSLRRLIAVAYGVDSRVVLGGPKWVDSDSYDITARIPAEFVHQKVSRLPEMVQALLAERFLLTIHEEPREATGYALTTARKAPKLEPAAEGANGASLHSGNSRMTGENATMQNLAEHLSRNKDLGAIVVDRTGLSGRFNFDLNWKPEALQFAGDAAVDERPPIFRALQDQLGLKLESMKIPIRSLVIDRAEKPEIN